MDAKLKAKWIRALRSRKYRRGEGQLRDESNSFCCLGVLCDVAGLEAEMVETDNCYEYSIGQSKSAEYLPEKFRRSAGITKTQQSNLATMNDNGSTFGKIANWIKANL